MGLQAGKQMVVICTAGRNVIFSCLAVLAHTRPAAFRFNHFNLNKFVLRIISESSFYLWMISFSLMNCSQFHFLPRSVKHFHKCFHRDSFMRFRSRFMKHKRVNSTAIKSLLLRNFPDESWDCYLAVQRSLIKKNYQAVNHFMSLNGIQKRLKVRISGWIKDGKVKRFPWMKKLLRFHIIKQTGKISKAGVI